MTYFSKDTNTEGIKMPLKGIPFILSPDLLHALCSMGHGDEIVLADAHFPGSSICRNGPKELRADGHGIPELLAAILKVFPLDSYVPKPVALMALVLSDKEKKLEVPVWEKYQLLVDAAAGKKVEMEKVERFEFYERAKRAFAVVQTGECSKYGNIILKKGCVVE
ncbi:fucose mutarotase [Lingula anatina]|uniref:L-fucose mutarotase n=1 Tax=Lingula anatina TaxID=7574 RepID=A0A1S3I585_LINAN|nr:fucose mutarotase [Lingula anatina]|eukprot:XP_013392996.1 fucose mutarotase [Lingula anatina]